MPHVCIGKNPGWFALAPRKGGSIPRFPDEPVGKEDVEVRSEGAVAVSVGVRSAATVAVVCDVEVYD